jgi:hypothetical protein
VNRTKQFRAAALLAAVLMSAAPALARYLAPEAFGQPAERGVERARYPELRGARR